MVISQNRVKGTSKNASGCFAALSQFLEVALKMRVLKLLFNGEILEKDFYSMEKRIFVFFSVCLLLVSVLSCSKQRYKPGIYQGTGRGKSGDIIVEILVLQNGNIGEMRIVQHSDTPGISDEVFLQLPRSIIKAKSTEIDTISGATFTSRGVLEAVNDALQKSMR